MTRSVVGSGPAMPRVVARATTFSIPRLAVLTLLAALAVLLAAIAATPVARAQDAASPITITAEPLLDGKVRAGEWAVVRVHVENAGPAVEGELRLRTATDSQASGYAIPVQLATGARQEHMLLGKAGFFGSRFTVDLVQDDQVVATTRVPVVAIDPDALSVFVVAERPEAIMADIRAAAGSRNGRAASVTAIAPEDLPDRSEAWGAVDRLVWQDVPAERLTTEQQDALRTWIALGGELVTVGGSGGTGSLDAFPDSILPYRPEQLVDVPVADLPQLLGTLPAGAAPVPALAGALRDGTVLGSTAAPDGSGELVFGARAGVGRGAVTIVGVDPATSWLVGSAVARDLWTSTLRPSDLAAGIMASQDDGVLVNALNYLPSVALPPMDQLFLLFLAYVLLLGPISYLVLRRLDRREWAWVVMPALALVFTVIAYGLGIVLKGTTVVVNELAVVRGAADADRGMADVYVGVFSPTRTAFDVTLPGGALLSGSTTDQQNGEQQPLDIVLGDPSRIRDFQVGFGSLRGFRAQSAVDTPRIETDLQLVGDRVQGVIRNASEQPLEDVAMVYGGAVQKIGDLAAGASHAVDVPVGGAISRGRLVRALFADEQAVDAADARSLASRVALVRHVSGDGWDWNGEQLRDEVGTMGPVLLAWTPGGLLDIEVGTGADRVGDTLYLLPVGVEAQGAVQLGASAIGHTVVESTTGSENSEGFYMDRGTMVVEYRPAGLEGEFSVTGLDLRLGSGPQAPIGTGTLLQPLPIAQQPTQEDPLRTGPAAPAPGVDGMELPAIQLFDRESGVWIELNPLVSSRTYAIARPQRFVDESGAFRVRFVSRGQGAYGFSLGARMSGTVS